MNLKILNLYGTNNLDYRYNGGSLSKITEFLKDGIEIKAKLKRELKIDDWYPKTWEFNYDYGSQTHLNEFDSVYVAPSFENEELSFLPINLPKGIEGRIYGVASLNANLEQDQFTNALLLGFPKENKLVPLTLLDITHNEDISIELVNLCVD